MGPQGHDAGTDRGGATWFSSLDCSAESSAYTADGLSIDVSMIGEGLARARTRDGQHRDTLMALEASARENRAGCLWGGLPDSPVSDDEPDHRE